MIVIEPPSSSSGHEAFDGLRAPELSRFVKKAQRAIGLRGDVTILLADDTRIQQLNRQFRGKNKSTDVLSFPAMENGEGAAGDLAMSVPIAAAQAESLGHTVMQELQILALHGLLHLAGLDHETDAGEMRTREAELRLSLGLPGGLIERTTGEPRKPAAKRTPVKKSVARVTARARP